MVHFYSPQIWRLVLAVLAACLMSAPIAAAISQDSRQLQDRQLQQPLHRQIQASDDASVNNLDSKMHRDNCLTQETIRSMRIRSVTTSPHLTGLDLSCNNAQRHQNQQRFKSAVHERRREHQSSKCSQDKASKKQSTLPKHSKHNSSHNKPAVKKHASQHEKGRGKHSKKQQQKERKDDRHRSFRRATFHKKGKIYMLAHQDWYTQYRRQRGPKGVMRKLTLDNTRRRKAMITFLPSSYSRINDRLSDDIDDDGNVIVDPNAGPGVVSFDNSYKGDLESQTGDENEDDTEVRGEGDDSENTTETIQAVRRPMFIGVPEPISYQHRGLIPKARSSGYKRNWRELLFYKVTICGIILCVLW